MNQKSQSAMEYLMTYGWSILIVAVVLGALAYLGVFNPLYFAPKANPGSCQVFRPNGAGTSYDINLLGVCNGELPQYVASFNGYNGIVLPGTTSNHLSSFTLAEWISSTANCYCASFSSANVNNYGWQADSAYGDNLARARFDTSTALNQVPPGPNIDIKTGQFFFYVLTFSYPANVATVYVNAQSGNPIGISGVFPVSTASNNLIGLQVPTFGGGNWYGYIANMQLYNASLDQSSITALYQEGIGGAPIDLQNLVGWWPLNGNANDYSGNGYNGASSTGVAYTSSWISSYNPP